MRESQKLSFPEFLRDLRGVILSPRQRFQVIQERGASWGSLLVLFLPIYLEVPWTAGIGVEGNPKLAYSLLFPAVVTSALIVLKTYPIHLFGRLFQAGRPDRSGGTFRQLLTVFGYTTIPSLLALVLAFSFLLLLSEAVGILLRDYRVAAISVAVALGVALYVWHFILVVLALRTVYPLRDLKIVIVFVLGSLVGGFCAWLAIRPVVEPVKIESVYVEPILSDRALWFNSVEPGVTTDAGIEFHVDRLRYRFHAPARFELVTFDPSEEFVRSRAGAEGQTRDGKGKVPHYGRKLAGRILGLPGEQVEVNGGRVTIGQESWSETYLALGYAKLGAFRSRQLGPEEYLVLPDNRNLVSSHPNEWYVSRGRIYARMPVVRWPLGGMLFRPTVFAVPR